MIVDWLGKDTNKMTEILRMLVKQEDCSLATFNQTLFGLAYESPEKVEQAAMAR